MDMSEAGLFFMSMISGLAEKKEKKIRESGSGKKKRKKEKKMTTKCLMGFLLEDGIVVGKGMNGKGFVDKE